MFNLRRRNKNDIKLHDAHKLIIKNLSNVNFVILDVRSPEEYSEAHIDNAKNIDYNSSTFKEELEKMDKNREYLGVLSFGSQKFKRCENYDKIGFHRFT